MTPPDLGFDVIEVPYGQIYGCFRQNLYFPLVYKNFLVFITSQLIYNTLIFRYHNYFLVVILKKFLKKSRYVYLRQQSRYDRTKLEKY